MVHCIAVPRNDEVIEKIDIGKLIKDQIEKNNIIIRINCSTKTKDYF